MLPMGHAVVHDGKSRVTRMHGASRSLRPAEQSDSAARDPAPSIISTTPVGFCDAARRGNLVRVPTSRGTPRSTKHPASPRSGHRPPYAGTVTYAEMQSCQKRLMSQRAVGTLGCAPPHLVQRLQPGAGTWMRSWQMRAKNGGSQYMEQNSNDRLTCHHERPVAWHKPRAARLSSGSCGAAGREHRSRTPG